MVVLAIPLILYFSYETPPKPEVTYGEFPFTLIYEIDGERVEVKDTLVVEYLGVGANEGRGKYNEWNRYLKSKYSSGYMRNSVVLYEGLFNNNSAIVYLELGSCEYYMGLEEEALYYYHSDVRPGDIVLDTPGYYGALTDEELYDKFKIEIIKKEISSPIESNQTEGEVPDILPDALICHNILDLKKQKANVIY